MTATNSQITSSSGSCLEVVRMLQFVLVLVGAPLLLYLMWKAILVIIYLLIASTLNNEGKGDKENVN